MNNLQGWTKIYRQIKKWQHYQESTVFHVFVDLFLSASTEDVWHKGMEIKVGELFTSVSDIHESTGLDAKTIRKALEKLESSGEISRETSNLGSKITITNFSKFQLGKISTTKSPTKNVGSGNNPQPTPQPTPQQDKNIENKEEKEEKEEKETPSIACACVREEVGFEVFGEFGNVQLKPVERRALVERYGEDAVNAAIADLSLKLADGSTQSTNHYATLLYWLSCRKSNIGGAARFAKPAPQTDPRCETKEQRIKRLRDLWEQASEADRQSYLNTYNCYPWERED